MSGFLKNKQFSSAVIQSTDDRFTIPNVKHLARKPGQRQRPKTTAATILSPAHLLYIFTFYTHCDIKHISK
jgi:hypothetical protein